MVKKKRQSDPGDNEDDSTESCEENVKSACPHVAKAVDLTKLKRTLKIAGFDKECSECKKINSVANEDPDYEEDLSLWICLRCGSQLCGRRRNKHALNHFNTPHSDCHALTANTTSWEVYCYNCNNEVTTTSSKKLHECIEYLKKQAVSNATKPLPPIELFYSVSEETLVKAEPVAKGKEKAMALQRVRGLSNLGNTCFFNSVMQCLVQTPYLLNVLQEMANPGEKFLLPGGTLKLKGDGDKTKELVLPPIAGELAEWGTLTRTLAETLSDLQSGEGGVYNPRKLLSALVNKLPQFGGGDQHDSHELLRHLLEGVRSEDLRRYQSVILNSLGMSQKVDPSKVDGEVKQKVKFYGQQASDTMLRPEQVPRTTEDWKKIAKEFERRWNFPNCMGAVDGKHIEIEKPSNSGSYYFNYMKTFSIVLMAIVNANYQFMMVDIGANGRMSDGGTLKNTKFWQLFSENENKLNIPEPCELPECDKKFPFVLIGDEAFQLTPNFMKPYNKAVLTDERRVFNYRLSRARRVVENAFGILSWRFKIFKKDIGLHPDKTRKIVLAACHLHNYLCEKSKNTYIQPGDVDIEKANGTITQGTWRQGRPLLNIDRVQGNSANEAKKVRDDFCEYFNSNGSVPWQNNCLI